MVVYAASPFLTANASADSTYYFPGENTESIDLSSYFNGKNGSFVLYDTIKDHYMIYNEDLSTQRVSPDSTFKIYSGLFALEEGIISADSTERAWDGTVYSIDSWNQDQTLATAMQNSANWYFPGTGRTDRLSCTARLLHKDRIWKLRSVRWNRGLLGRIHIEDLSCRTGGPAVRSSP